MPASVVKFGGTTAAAAAFALASQRALYVWSGCVLTSLDWAVWWFVFVDCWLGSQLLRLVVVCPWLSLLVDGRLDDL